MPVQSANHRKHRYIQKSPMQGTIAWHSGHLFILRYHCIQLFCIIQQLRDKKSLYSNPRFSRSASFVYEESSALSGMISISYISCCTLPLYSGHCIDKYFVRLALQRNCSDFFHFHTVFDSLIQNIADQDLPFLRVRL